MSRHSTNEWAKAPLEQLAHCTPNCRHAWRAQSNVPTHEHATQPALPMHATR